MSDLRRSTILFSQNQPGDSLYFVEEGLVKLTRTNAAGHRIILSVRGANDLVGEEVLADEETVFHSEAEVLTTASVLRLSRDAIRDVLTNAADAMPLISYLISQKTKLADKVELLCLQDVEYRILFYLAELCKLVRPSDSGEYQLPLTQLELADLIGATRETTSTTLNQLERRGLVKLSRRMMTVPSLAVLRGGAGEKAKEADGVDHQSPDTGLLTQSLSS